MFLMMRLALIFLLSYRWGGDGGVLLKEEEALCMGVTPFLGAQPHLPRKSQSQSYNKSRNSTGWEDAYITLKAPPFFTVARVAK